MPADVGFHLATHLKTSLACLGGLLFDMAFRDALFAPCRHMQTWKIVGLPNIELEHVPPCNVGSVNAQSQKTLALASPKACDRHSETSYGLPEAET